MKRDKRIDMIGYVEELKRQLVDSTRTKVRTQLIESGDNEARGSDFAAILTGGGDARAVDAEAFFRLYEKKVITRQEFLSAISVSVSDAERLMTSDKLATICVSSPASRKMSIVARTSEQLTPKQLLKRLAQFIRS